MGSHDLLTNRLRLRFVGRAKDAGRGSVPDAGDQSADVLSVAEEVVWVLRSFAG